MHLFALCIPSRERNTNTMINITKFKWNIHQYVNLGKEIYIAPVFGCRSCGYIGRLHRHGYYSRNVITLHSSHRINVLRLKCPRLGCFKTYSMLPSFLIPYYQYSFDFIFTCLYFLFLLNTSYSKFASLLKQVDPNSTVTNSHLNHFKRRFKKELPFLNYFFAQFPDMYYQMDQVNLVSILKKLTFFRSKYLDFNQIYFEKMSRYFFAKN